MRTELTINDLDEHQANHIRTLCRDMNSAEDWTTIAERKYGEDSPEYRESVEDYDTASKAYQEACDFAGIEGRTQWEKEHR